MSTLRIKIRVSPELHELVVAELADLGCDAFEEYGDEVLAYIPTVRWDDADRKAIDHALHRTGQPFTLEEESIPDTNSNQEWEASLHPVDVPPFLIKPSWRPMRPEYAGRIILEIDPKMSFGTGYHASTRLALRLLPDLVTGDELVLDAGCGTGILALAALKLGARRAIGFDIDEWASANAGENAEQNGLWDRFEVRQGTIDVIPEKGFDLVLANINRNVLLELLPDFMDRLAADGSIILAGLLTTDRDVLLQALAGYGLAVLEECTEADWWAVAATVGAGSWYPFESRG